MSEALKALVAQATGLPPETLRIRLRPPLEHQSNRLYDAWAGERHLIAKEYLKPDEWDDAPVREFRSLELLAPLDVAPQPVWLEPRATPSLGPVVVYRFMEGKMWGRRRPAGSELAELAELWFKVNAVPTDNLWLSRGYERPLEQTAARFAAQFRAYAEWAEAEYTPARQAADLCLKVLASRWNVVRELAAGDPPLCFCRSDARFANVIRRPGGRLGMVDWEDSGLRDPARDLADLMTHANQEDLLSPDEWQAFLQPYLAARGRADPQLSHRTHLYMALFPPFWLASLIRGGMRRAEDGRWADWRANGLSANERLRRYLARAMAWPETDLSENLEATAGMVFFPNE